MALKWLLIVALLLRPLRRVFTSRLEAGQAAKSIMVKSNYRLVVNIVSKYRGRGEGRGGCVF